MQLAEHGQHQTALSAGCRSGRGGTMPGASAMTWTLSGFDAQRRQRRQGVGLGVQRVDRPRACAQCRGARSAVAHAARATTCSPGMAP